MKLSAQISNKNQKGFTLIELLVVIGILAVLLAITLIAINPARQFANANNTKRRSDVLQSLNAIGQYMAENKGQLPAEVAAIDDTQPPVAFNQTNFPNLCAQLIPDYIPALPTDPSLNTADITLADCNNAASGWDTGYELYKDATNRVTVSAPDAENGAIIEVTR